MNVQTLPPGYKAAPWTPPEKIDGKMLADASAKLIDLLRIRTQPIGMRLFEDPADMNGIPGVRKPTEGFKFTMCQMVTQARWYGFTLGITVDNTRGGNCGGVVGLNHPGEDFLSGDHMNGVWFGNKEASAAHQAQMPRVPNGKYNGLVVSPLRSGRLDPPDICLFYGTPGQMIYFINGLQFHRYRRYDFTVTGESACADSWGRALATRQTSLSLPCYAERRYGGINQKVEDRLQEELRLIGKHNLAGFFLIYYEIIQMARQIMIEMGLSDAEIPLEERPPGRGRGSSVSMLVGYLIGLSHIDPLKYNLSLDRFLSDDLGSVPDIDLDFPRNIREELIVRVHRKWGWDRAALTGMISTYQMKGVIRDLGKALGLPSQDLDKLAKRTDSHDAKEMELEMLQLPEFRDKVDAPGWRDLIEMAAQLDGFPKYLAQHPGGMIISSSPLIDTVPVQQAAIADRYICHWDKDSIDQAGFVKIDFLALGALSQMQECLLLIEEREGNYIDLSRIDFDDRAVYETIHRADTIGIFQVESAAQMQTTPRIKPWNLTDMAYEVGAVRPGVGVNDGVTQFIRRRSEGIPWDYDHPLEQRALERTLGIILFQDQVNQVAVDVAGFTPLEADQMRRAFGKRNNDLMIQHYWKKFLEGATGLGVSEDAAQRIFKKFNGHYMFPESHAFAFGATAYHMAWLKYYYPLEFYVAIFNQQPMGFYNTETLKEDAKRHGITVLNPDINHSREKCIIRNESLLLGLRYVRGMGDTVASQAVAARDQGGPFKSLADAMERTGLQREIIENLVTAGAFDALNAQTASKSESKGSKRTASRRQALWEVGLRYRPINTQQPLPLPVEQDMAELPDMSEWETMGEEYRILGLYPEGHLMALARPHLRPGILSSRDIEAKADGDIVTVAGLVIRRQRPLAKAVFLTLEDEFGHIPLVVWPSEFAKYRQVIREPLLIIRGEVSRREGTMNIVTHHVEPMPTMKNLPKAKSWQ